MTKIQLKRSSVLENGSAKEPLVSQTEYGELCVNYNEADPAIFIRDSNDQIIRIVGAGSSSSGDVPSGGTPPNTGNEVGDLFFDTTTDELKYWNGSEWIVIPGSDGSYPNLGDGDGATLDARFLKVVGDNMTGDLTFDTNKIVLGVDGTASFSGKITSASTEAADSADTLVTKDYLVEYTSGLQGQNFVEVAGSNMTGDLTLGTDKITLDASNGSAEFVGDISIGGTLPSAPNISLNADGSAEFADGNIVLNADGDVRFKKDFATFVEGDLDSFNSSTSIVARNNDKTNIESGSFIRIDNIGNSGYKTSWYVGSKSEIGNATNTSSNGSSFKISQLTNISTDTVTDRLMIARTGQVLVPSSFLVGGTLPSSPNISLNSDGSAEFTGAINGITVGIGSGDVSTNTVVGVDALKENTTGASNVANGQLALCFNTVGDYNTAIGRLAGRYKQNGNDATDFDNCSYLGYDTRASASNQVQLGDSTTTTYAYGAVQNRSDARDKTDIRDTLLGLDFIKSLRPVDFRWDMRDDYFNKEEYQVEETRTRQVENPAYVVDGDEPEFIEEEYTETITNERLVATTKDGSRSRDRFHHGLIAQEVKAAADEQGIDFAGYQDHSIDGGCDVLSIGYSELIAPLIKAVQELSAENAALKQRLDDAGIA